MLSRRRIPDLKGTSLGKASDLLRDTQSSTSGHEAIDALLDNSQNITALLAAHGEQLTTLGIIKDFLLSLSCGSKVFT